MRPHTLIANHRGIIQYAGYKDILLYRIQSSASGTFKHPYFQNVLKFNFNSSYVSSIHNWTRWLWRKALLYCIDVSRYDSKRFRNTTYQRLNYSLIWFTKQIFPFVAEYTKLNFHPKVVIENIVRSRTLKRILIKFSF